MRSYLDRAYHVVKMKIGGASLEQDLRRIEAVLEVVGVGSRLAVDANGRRFRSPPSRIQGRRHVAQRAQGHAEKAGSR